MMERAKNYAVFVVGFMMTFLAFYPGMMTWDSNVQYGQALAFEFVDRHPTVMALVWSALLNFAEGPVPMLTLHLAMFWIGASLFYSYLRERSPGASRLLVILVFMPTTFSIIGVISKDVGMMSSSVFLVGLLIGAARKGRVGAVYKVALAAVLYYIINIRYNSVLAAMPFVVLILQLIFTKKSIIKLALIAVAIVACMFLAHRFVDSFVLQTEKKGTEFQLKRLFSTDVSGIQIHGGDVGFDALRVGREKMENSYLDMNKDELQFSSHAQANLRANGDRELSDYASTWLEAVGSNPYEYASHRIYTFNRALRVGVENNSHFAFPVDGIAKRPVDYCFEFEENPIFESLRRYAHIFRDVVVFKGWIYFVINLLVITTCVVVWSRTRTIDFAAKLALAMNASSILYLLPYLLITYVLTWRFIYPAVMITTLSVPVYLVSSVHGRVWREGVDRVRATLGRFRRKD